MSTSHTNIPFNGPWKYIKSIIQQLFPNILQDNAKELRVIKFSSLQPISQNLLSQGNSYLLKLHKGEEFMIMAYILCI